MNAENDLPLGKLRSAARWVASFGRKSLETVRFRPDWRGILSSWGQLAAISLISVGCGWYSFGAGFISGGVGLLAFSVAAGMPK